MTAKILIVDDSATDRMIAQNMLSDFNVLTANDGLEAMRKLEDNADIDLIILDLNMPKMDGFQVLKELKSNDRYKKLRTIILTNYDELDNEIKGLKLGAIDYIRKPLNIESLRVRIEIHLELLKIQQRTEQDLDNSTLIFKTIFDQAPIGIAISDNNKPLDPSGEHATDINPMFEKIIGRTKEEFKNMGWAEITHPEDVNRELESYKKFQTGEINGYAMEKRFIKPDGAIVWVHVIVAPLKINNVVNSNYLCLVEDITDRKEQEIRLKYVSEHDTLTGLYNRRYLEELLERDVIAKTNNKKAIVLLNLKKINSINLTYGYNFSENIIKQLAVSLSALTQNNRKLFQISFERFAFYMDGYESRKELSAFCDSIVEVINKTQIIHVIGCGIGVVEIDSCNDDVSSILRNASIVAELANENMACKYCFFEDELLEEINRVADIKNELLIVAQEENNESIYLEYQPIIDPRTNQILEFEALARMKSKKLGIVPPMEFIPLAEEMELIIPIGQKVIRMAGAFLKRLESEGYDNLKVLVNVSAIQLLRDEFLEDLIQIIEEMQINTFNLGLEITESIFSENYEIINIKIGKLREMGVKISIDDFGTGFSSLARERELNVNCLKIDKYFIDKLLFLHPDEAITSDIISMAHKLGHCVVAEGVEHEKQKEYLIKHNCDLIQGYIFSKPLDQEEAIKLLKKTNMNGQ